MPRDFHLPGRSPVYAGNAMAATSHPLATETAISVLRSGGNAVDAAIAAAAVLAVVEPHMTGIGGDCFAIVAEQDKPLSAINGCGRAPAGADVEALTAAGHTQIPLDSPHAVTVPGAIDAWQRLLEAHGTRGFDTLLRPAIRFAEEGFAVAPRVGHDWQAHGDSLAADEGAARYYLKDGRPYRTGETCRFPALAKTLKTLADKGRDAFYEGELAQAMVAHLQSLGGSHTLDDFAGHRGEFVTPLTSSYRGFDTAQIPPNSHGLTTQIMLNILEQFDLADLDPAGPERFHLEMEAARSAYRVRDQLIADPDCMTITAQELIDKALGKRFASHIDPAARSDDLGAMPKASGSDTIYLTIVDANWTAVSFINSIYHAFGTHIAHPELGLLYHNRGAGFVLDADHPNRFGPSKRPMHTIIPGMVSKDGRAVLSYGVMGAAYQPVGQAHVLTNVVDYGMDIQQAIDHERTFIVDGQVACERGVKEETRAGLALRGHEVVVSDEPWGGGQGIALDWDRGVLVGGSDPRKDGCAIGF